MFHNAAATGTAIAFTSADIQLQPQGKIMKNGTLNKICITALALFALSTAHAIPVLDVQTPGSEYNGGSWTLGFEFTVNQDISVTSLGVYDSGMNGLSNDAQVGIWDNNGNLLASAIVGAGTAGELDGYFRFTDIAALALSIGNSYYAGSYSGDTASSCNTNQGGSCIIDPIINVIQDRYAGIYSFGFPSSSNGRTQGSWLGANFRYNEAAAVPAPGSLALIGAGLLGMALVRRRKFS